MVAKAPVASPVRHFFQPPLIELPDGCFQCGQASWPGHGGFKSRPDQIVDRYILVMDGRQKTRRVVRKPVKIGTCQMIPVHQNVNIEIEVVMCTGEKLIPGGTIALLGDQEMREQDRCKQIMRIALIQSRQGWKPAFKTFCMGRSGHM